MAAKSTRCGPRYPRAWAKDRAGVDVGRMAEVDGRAGSSSNGWFCGPDNGVRVCATRSEECLEVCMADAGSGGGGARGPDSDRDGSVEATWRCAFWARLHFAFSMSIPSALTTLTGLQRSC